MSEEKKAHETGDYTIKGNVPKMENPPPPPQVTQPELSVVNLDSLSDEELDALIKERNAKRQKAAEAARAQYEEKREEVVRTLIDAATDLNAALFAFKTHSLTTMSEFQKLKNEFSGGKAAEHENFTIYNNDQTMKIEFRRHAVKNFNELAGEAEKLLKEFLTDKVKKRSQEVYLLVSSLLERKKDGDYDLGLIQRLYKMEDKFDDPNWKRAIELFKQSFQETDSATYIRFYRREGENTWKLINLNFASV